MDINIVDQTDIVRKVECMLSQRWTSSVTVLQDSSTWSKEGVLFLREQCQDIEKLNVRDIIDNLEEGQILQIHNCVDGNPRDFSLKVGPIKQKYDYSTMSWVDKTKPKKYIVVSGY